MVNRFVIIGEVTRFLRIRPGSAYRIIRSVKSEQNAHMSGPKVVLNRRNVPRRRPDSPPLIPKITPLWNWSRTSMVPTGIVVWEQSGVGAIRLAILWSTAAIRTKRRTADSGGTSYECHPRRMFIWLPFKNSNNTQSGPSVFFPQTP